MKNFSDSLEHGTELLKEIGHGFLDLLFPPRCAGCSECKPALFCDDCRKTLRAVPEPQCPVCGKTVDERGCYDCKVRKPFFHKADSLYVYEGAIRNALLAWKYKPVESLGAVMGELLIEGLRKSGGGQVLNFEPAGNQIVGADPCVRPPSGDMLTGRTHGFAPTRALASIFNSPVDIIIPVPLHESRLKERGFNQSEVLAEALSLELDAPMKARHLKRIRATALQSRLNKEQRMNNVRGAFNLLWAKKLYGKRVLLVDDIMTTGSTLNECARLLRNAGVKRVDRKSVV